MIGWLKKRHKGWWGIGRAESAAHPVFNHPTADISPPKVRVDDLMTPFPQVLEELKRRAKDTKLHDDVLTYLSGDLPDYFKDGPVLYLARHIATPNFETLRFLHLTEPLSMKTVIGQDSKDRFVAHNPLKKALGKLSICTAITQKEGKLNEQFQNISIFDFNTENGKAFKDIRTFWGEPLVDFHLNLFGTFAKHGASIIDDGEWIDRNHRGDLLEHYKKFLALFIVNGILFEDYLVEDKQEGEFITNVLRPAFEHVERELGVRPLITQLTPTSIESGNFWLSYPKEVLEIVEEKMTYTIPT